MESDYADCWLAIPLGAYLTVKEYLKSQTKGCYGGFEAIAEFAFAKTDCASGYGYCETL